MCLLETSTKTLRVIRSVERSKRFALEVPVDRGVRGLASNEERPFGILGWLERGSSTNNLKPECPPGVSRFWTRRDSGDSKVAFRGPAYPLDATSRRVRSSP
jgi:hypothetical protein